ncbi:MAG: hypothetical protein HY934_03140, partial [Candidatus Firestonebacteria bacterium]|nr:hypothetical protein [Candidatus Firestonebacteria bacterium]
MILTQLNFSEFECEKDYWEIKNVNFDLYNLVIGLNSTGKTRLVSVISSLALMIEKNKEFANGYWNVSFKKENNDIYNYTIKILNKNIINEEIKINKKLFLKRENENGEIFSYTTHNMIKFNPPKEKLTINVRRDIKEFPFLEYLLTWAKE